MKKILLTLLIVMALGACSDSWIHREPFNRPISGQMKKYEDAIAGANGLYDIMRYYTYYGRDFVYYGDVISEDLRANGTTKRSYAYYAFTSTKDNASGSFWSRMYSVIVNANSVIDGIENIELPENTTEKQWEEVNHALGEAYVIRGLAHFDLMRVYCYPYLKPKDGSTNLTGDGSWDGIPIVDFVPDAAYKPDSRGTVREVIDFVIADLHKAAGTVTDAGALNNDALCSTSRYHGHINRCAALALLSRAYLYKGDWTNALKYAKATITASEAAGFSLWTRAQYADPELSWGQLQASEGLFQLVFTEDESNGTNSIGNLYKDATRGGYYDIVVSDNYRDFMESGPVRKEDLRYTLFQYDCDDDDMIWKYPGNDGEYFRHADVLVIRLSEVYLIAAEAAAHLNNSAEALAYLRPIAERGNPDVVLPSTITVDRVLDERRMELIGEGHRGFDMLRNGRMIKRKTAAEGGDHHTGIFVSSVDPSQNGWTYNWNFYKTAFAIYKNEMDGNPGLRDKQNPGWETLE